MVFGINLSSIKDIKLSPKTWRWIGYGAAGLSLLALGKSYFNGGVSKSEADLTGQVVIITGANTGIGKETALALAQRGATLVLACRNKSKTEAVIEEIKTKTGNTNIEYMYLDLSNLKSVLFFAQDFKAKHNKINILINNAGIMRLPFKRFTADGYEMQFGVNHLGHFYLTNLLNDELKNGAPSRVINVSSLAHIRGSISWEDINLNNKYSPRFAYAQSKLANILFTKEYAKIHKDDNIKTVSLHPGVVRTELGRHMTDKQKMFMYAIYPLFWYFTKTPTQGAQTTIECALMPFDKLESGAYYSDCKTKEVSQNGQNEQDATRFWGVSQQLIDDRFADPYMKGQSNEQQQQSAQEQGEQIKQQEEQVPAEQKQQEEGKGDEKEPVEGEQPADSEKPAESEQPVEGQQAEGEQPSEQQLVEGEQSSEQQPAEGEKPAEEQPVEGEKPSEEQPSEQNEEPASNE